MVTVLTQLIKYLVPRKVDEGRSKLVGLRAGTGRAAGFAEGFGEVLLQKHLPERFRDKLCVCIENDKFCNLGYETKSTFL